MWPPTPGTEITPAATGEVDQSERRPLPEAQFEHWCAMAARPASATIEPGSRLQLPRLR